MIYVFFVLLVVYIILILLLIFGFSKIQAVETGTSQPKTRFSIIVPFRNEENDFENFLKSISVLNYPLHLFEIIVVNDDSNDNSVMIFNRWKSQNTKISSTLLENCRKSNSPKKDAIQTAISKIKNDWIITTDADCLVQQNWLLAYDSFIQTSNFEMLAAAVSISNNVGFLNYFQFVDLLSLQGTTIGSFGISKPFMCNGANFAYTKNMFVALNGFDGNDKIASGDDVFLLQKAIRLFPKKVSYFKNHEATVFTKPEPNWSKLFQQRVRWASKTGFYDGFFEKFLAIIVLLVNVTVITNFWFLPFDLCLLGFLLKCAVDLILINKTNRFITKTSFIFPFLSSVFYPFFCVLVAFYSFFGNYNWKNRIFKV